MKLKIKINQKPFTFAVAVWLVIIFIAHFFAPPGYVWTNNTISELASQGHSHKWIMQAGLMSYGLLVMLAVGLASIKERKMLFYLLPVGLYGLGIFLSGIFCAAPIDPRIAFSVEESNLHSRFATLAGFSLSAGILWRIFLASNGRERMVHTFFLFAIVVFAVLFGLAESEMLLIGKGIVQRLMYLSGFAWLIFQENLPVREDKTVKRVDHARASGAMNRS